MSLKFTINVRTKLAKGKKKENGKQNAINLENNLLVVIII